MAKEYFPTIGKIPFEGAESKNPPWLSIIMTPSAWSWASP